MVNSCRLNEDLRGLCEELELFPGTNALEILDITIIVYAVDHLVSVRDEWGWLDTVLSHGFSQLLEVLTGVILHFLVQRHAGNWRGSLESNFPGYGRTQM